MDWGLAKSVEEPRAEERRGTGGVTAVYQEPSHTLPGEVKGTPSYMAPEQARGAWDQVDARADVFALGGILAAMLTGKAPFTGKTIRDTILMAAQGELTDCFARLDCCGADMELLSLVKRCLAPKIEERFRNGKEVADAIATYRTRVEERLQQAKLNTVRAEGERARPNLKPPSRASGGKCRSLCFSSVFLFVIGAGAVAWWQDKEVSTRKQKESRIATLSPTHSNGTKTPFVPVMPRQPE